MVSWNQHNGTGGLITMAVDKRYLVRFVRRDGQPDEIYDYAHRSDAEYHFGLFRDDDSGLLFLYKKTE